MARQPNKNHRPVGKDQFSSLCHYFHTVMLPLCPDHTLNIATNVLLNYVVMSLVWLVGQLASSFGTPYDFVLSANDVFYLSQYNSEIHGCEAVRVIWAFTYLLELISFAKLSKREQFLFQRSSQYLAKVSRTQKKIKQDFFSLGVLTTLISF